LNSWTWQNAAAARGKDDLEHTFAATYQDSGYATNGSVHTLLFTGADRYDSGETTKVNTTPGVWLLHNPIDEGASGTFVIEGSGKATSATFNAAGAGYSVNNLLTVSGGTFATPAQFKVTAVNGTGGVTAVSLVAAGRYSIVPSNPAVATGGTGSGCKLSVVWLSPSRATHTNGDVLIVANFGTGGEAVPEDSAARLGLPIVPRN
jgi:hypothetical protein